MEHCLTRALKVAIAAAKAGGEVLKRGRTRELEIKEKDESRTSIVTSVDLQSQQEIVNVIRKAFPGHAIVGEEGTTGDSQAECIWFVDPLDGTTNYSHGLPFYCVSVALCDQHGICAGVIYDPYREDLFLASRGGGAKLNGRGVVVSSTRSLRTSILATQVQSDNPIMLDRYASRSRRFVASARAHRAIGSPALSLAYVAAGWLDAYCEPDMSPWDTLAGTLLVREAGGRVTTFVGEELPVRKPASILASNGLLHADLLQLLKSDDVTASTTASIESHLERSIHG